MKSREDIYRDKCIELKVSIAKHKRQSSMFLVGKLLSFALLVTTIVLFYDNITIVTLHTILLAAVLYIMFIVHDEKLKKSIAKLRRIYKIYQNEISYLEGDFTNFDSGDKYKDIYHKFTYDLDIFGLSSLYNRINRTVTDKGSDALARKLQTIPTDTKSVVDNQSAIKELSGMAEWRVDFSSNNYIYSNLELLAAIAKSSEAIRGKFIYSKYIYISISMMAIALILAITSVVSWSLFSIMFTLHLVVVIYQNRATTEISGNADKISEEFKSYLELLKIVEKADFQSPKLNNISNNLLRSNQSCMASFKSLALILNSLDQRSNVFVYILLNGLFLYDILLVRSFISWEKRYMAHIEGWIEDIGELDALVSLATYVYNTPQNSWATIIDSNIADSKVIDKTVVDSKVIDSKTTDIKIIETTDLYHPFLPYHKAISNSFTLDTNNISIITGANMAGKSTFLRSIGVNYILAANGVSVCAKEFRFSLVSLFSSMRTSDDLSNNISYFNAELLRLKQLIIHCTSHPYTLIILDEILKGTNSIDKLKGSIIFLETLANYPVSGIIATHDLELAKLEDRDNRLYTNYCFEIELTEEIEYSYKITKGVAQNLNATYLLSNMLKDINCNQVKL